MINNVVPAEVIVNLMRADYREWADSLTDEERNAIRKYSRNSVDKEAQKRFFVRLNAMLRGEYNQDDALLLARYAETISTALRKQPLTRNVLLYRGSDINSFAGLPVGTELRFDQFLSTSVISARALHKQYVYVIYAPPGTRGAYIEALSAYPRQREFLLDRGCTMRLQDIEKNKYWMEVMV